MIGDKNRLKIGNWELKIPVGDGRGFTLMETIVALAIFTTVLLASFSAFTLSLSAHRAILAEKAISENVNYAVEFMSRQMRVAKRDGAGGCIASNTTYQTFSSDTEIKFINGGDECVRFFLSAGAIHYENITLDPGTIIPLTTSAVVSVDLLDFSILGESRGDIEQPRATITIRASGVGNRPEVQGARVDIQTTVVARGLDI